MDTILMNSENNKTSDLHRLILNLIDKVNLKANVKYVALSNLSIYYTWKNKKFIKKLNLKYQPQHRTSKMNYWMNYILYQIFKDYFECIIKTQETVTENSFSNEICK